MCVTHTSISSWCCDGTQKRPTPTNIISYFKQFIVFLTFRNLSTEYIKPRKSQQVDFAKSEKEHFVEGIATPCLFRVQSSRTGHEYKVTHTTTHTVFQIDSWVKSLSCLLSRHIYEEMCFIIPRNLLPCLDESALMKYYFQPSQDLELG